MPSWAQEVGWIPNLSWARIPRVDLSRSTLQHAKFRGTVLRESDLRGSNLSHAYFREADLRRADLRGVNFEGTDLEDADLRGADLRDAKNLTREQLDTAVVDETTRLPEDLG